MLDARQATKVVGADAPDVLGAEVECGEIGHVREDVTRHLLQLVEGEAEEL